MELLIDLYLTRVIFGYKSQRTFNFVCQRTDCVVSDLSDFDYLHTR